MTDHSTDPAQGGFAPEAITDARRDFSHAVRSNNMEAAIRTLQRALAVPAATAEVESDWADFVFRTLRSIATRIPDSDHADILDAFLRRFPQAGPHVVTARNRLNRLRPRGIAVQSLQAPKQTKETPALPDNPPVAAPKKQDAAEAVRVFRMALARERPSTEIAAWAAKLSGQLRSLIVQVPEDQVLPLQTAFLARFAQVAEVVEPLVKRLLRDHGVEAMLQQIAALPKGSGQAEVADLMVRVMQLAACRGIAPGEHALPVITGEDPHDLSLGALVRRTALRLSKTSSLPGTKTETICYVPSGVDEKALHMIVSAFGVHREGRLVFDTAEACELYSAKLVAKTGMREDQLIVMPSFDLRNDDDIWEEAGAVAKEVVERLLAAASDMLSERLMAVREDLPDILTDRIIGVVRRRYVLRQYLSAGTTRLIVCPVTPKHVALAYDLASRSGESGTDRAVNCEVILPVWPQCSSAPIDMRDPVLSGAGRLTQHRLKQIDPVVQETIRKELQGQEILFVSNLTDRIYPQTMWALADTSPDAVYCVSVTELSEQTSQRKARPGTGGLRACILPLTRHTEIQDPDLVGLADTLVRVLAQLWAERADHIGRSILLHITMSSLLDYAMSAFDFFEAVFADRRTRALVVSPGRNLAARIAVRCAQRHAIPTFDIQAGTFSRLKRFRAPITDFVTCIDRPHFEIYSKTYGIDPSRILVSGSPRIDELLRPVRQLDRNSVRRSILASHEVEPLLLLATQPIELERMVQIVAIGLTAADHGFTVILKPHPAEGESRRAVYRAMKDAMASRDRIRIEPDLNVYEALSACDIVATYYSTVGQEGFALGRKVLVIDPFEVPPDPDFVGSGIAERIRSAPELAHVLSQDVKSIGPPVDPYLMVLQDGHAAERIWSFIREKVAKSGNRGPV